MPVENEFDFCEVVNWQISTGRPEAIISNRYNVMRRLRGLYYECKNNFNCLKHLCDLFDKRAVYGNRCVDLGYKCAENSLKMSGFVCR